MYAIRLETGFVMILAQTRVEFVKTLSFRDDWP